MKKTLTAMTLLAGAVSVYSQGVVSMNDYGGPFSIQVFQPQAPGVGTTVSVGGYSGTEVMGNSANSYIAPNSGTTVYAAKSTIGTAGNSTDIGLLATAGTGATTYNQLSLVTSSISSTWLDSITKSAINNNYGIWSASPSASIGPGSPTTATVALAAWQNTGPAGAATTLAQAQADGYNWGVSDIATVNLTVGTGSPGFLPTTLTSFSEVAVASPEPSTIALGVIGASAFLFRRRK